MSFFKNFFFIKGVSQRGQASAPFELMVAVIIMSFVMVVGYMVLDSVMTEICLNSVDNEMTKFKLALEDSVARMSSSPLTFRPEGSCFSSKTASLIIYKETTPSVCSTVCGFAAESCYVMKFNSSISNSFKRKCLNLPDFTSFDKGDSCRDTVLSGQGFYPVDLTVEGEFLPGSYVIRNIAPVGQVFPKLCVWYKAV